VGVPLFWSKQGVENLALEPLEDPHLQGRLRTPSSCLITGFPLPHGGSNWASRGMSWNPWSLNPGYNAMGFESIPPHKIVDPMLTYSEAGEIR